MMQNTNKNIPNVVVRIGKRIGQIYSEIPNASNMKKMKRNVIPKPMIIGINTRVQT